MFSRASRIITRQTKKTKKTRSRKKRRNALEMKKNEFFRLLVALSLSLACFVVELIGFLTGMSMFSNSLALICKEEMLDDDFVTRFALLQQLVLI